MEQLLNVRIDLVLLIENEIAFALVNSGTVLKLVSESQRKFSVWHMDAYGWKKGVDCTCFIQVFKRLLFSIAFMEVRD